MNPDNEQPLNQAPEPVAPQVTPLAPVPPVAPQPPVPVAPQGKDPGKTLGIVSLVLGLIGISLIGLILAIVAKMKSSKAGFKNTLAVVSIVINSILLFITPFVLLIMLTAFSGIQSLAKDKSTYSELEKLNAGLTLYISEKSTKPTSLSEVASNAGIDSSALTDYDGKAYTLTWDPADCSSLATCRAYTLSGASVRQKGEKISITVDGETGETTYVNKPTSSTSK